MRIYHELPVKMKQRLWCVFCRNIREKDFCFKEQGSQVKAGEEVISFEKKYLDSADMSTMLIYMDEEKKKALDKKIGITCKRAIDTVLEW